MASISVKQRLRPTRFGFLVRPDDASAVGQTFRINTCLWGGKFNPIIPFFRKVPAWWERKGYRFENATQIINGYLDFFEPDILVVAEKGLDAGLGFDPDRTLQLDDVLRKDGDRERISHGLSVMDLYRNLYKEEFQFVRRHKHDVVHVTAEDRAFANFAACVFGGFPAKKALAYFRESFEDAFAPKEIVLNGAALKKLYGSRSTSALRLGQSKIDIEYHDYHDPILFVLDASQSRDLLDFWNLRCVHRSVVPMPVQWLKELSNFCRDLIRTNHRPLPGNKHGVMIRLTVMFSRSIPDNDIERLHRDYLVVPDRDANVLQTWYPPIWRRTSEQIVASLAPTLNAGERSVDVPLDLEKPELRFELLHPTFSERFGGNNRWANVIDLADWTLKDRIATFFPANYRNPKFPKFHVGRSEVIPTTEGLVALSKYKDIPERWVLTNGAAAIGQWLKEHKIEGTISESGRTTQQIVETLDGFWGVKSIAHPAIIDLLEEMSRRPISKSAHYAEFKNKINVAVKNDIWRGREFDTLVERKAVELGLRLKCSKCGSWGWYSVKQLDYSIACDLCLKPFPFPVSDPGNSKKAMWAYRVIGPFALPNYAGGGYASALALRFFADVLGDGNAVTWSSGQDFLFEDGAKAEADFILWYRRSASFGHKPATETVFGEAKSKGRDVFKVEDVDRLKLLATRFPGSVLVFATMKDAKGLSKEEIQRIQRLAEWGRQYDKNRRKARAPVILLTGTELFAPWHLEPVWKELGGKHKALVDPGWVRLDNLRVLADMTQQLYLGMPPYHEWRDAYWKKRAARRKAKSVGVRNQ